MKKRKNENYVMLDDKGYILAYSFNDDFIKSHNKTLTELVKLKNLIKDEDIYSYDERYLDAEEIRFTERMKKACSNFLVKIVKEASNADKLVIKNARNNIYFREYFEA